MGRLPHPARTGHALPTRLVEVGPRAGRWPGDVADSLFAARRVDRLRPRRSRPREDGIARRGLGPYDGPFARRRRLAATVPRDGAARGAADGSLPLLLPAIADNDRVLALLRPDWNAGGDWIAVDHRATSDASRLELAADGRPWLRGSLRSDLAGEPDALPRPTAWATGPHADAQEWTFRAGPLKITRTAVLLRYRKLALLAQQEEGPAPASALRVSLADDVSASIGGELRLATLTRRRSAARLIPLSLPALPYPTDRGSFSIEGAEAVLRQPTAGRRRWLPMVVAWGKPPVGWRTLTVTEKSRICPPEVAFGARISWGVGQDGILIYRSLGRPALRAVLGHQTRARFLVAKFTTDGDVEPLLTLE